MINENTAKTFLEDKAGFLQIAEIIEKTISKSSFIAKPTIEDYVKSDEEGRKIAEEYAR